MSDLVFTTRGVAELLQAQEKLAESLGKQKTAARALSEEYRTNESELKRLQRVADQIYRNNETGQERYNRKLAEAKAALEGNVNETELLSREQKRLQKELDDTGKSGKSAGDHLAAAFDPKKLLGYAAGFVSIQAVVSAITSELRAQQEMIDKRNAAQLSVGESRNILLRNLIGQSPATIQSALGAAGSIAAETGMSEAAIARALASAVSATGANVPLSISLVQNAARFMKDRPEDIGEFAGSMGDLTQLLGGGNAQAALGLLSKISQLSRIVSPQQIAQNAPAAIIGAAQFGGDARTGSALYAALTTAGADKEGRHTATAMIQLAKQLEEASQGKGSFASTANKLGFTPGQLGGANLLERILFLQQNPQLALQFMDMASFEAKSLGPIRQLLLDPNSFASRQFAADYGQIPGVAGLSKLGTEALGIFGRYNTLEPVAERSRALSSGLERLQTRQPSEYLSTQDLENLRGLTLEAGGANLGNQLDTLIARAKGGGKVRAADAVDIIRRRADSLEHPSDFVTGGQVFGITRRDARLPTQEEKDSAMKLKETVDLLQKSLTEQQETNRILRTKPPLTWGSN